MTQKIRRGAYRGERIELASSERIEELQAIATDFMEKVFDFLPGDYLITDESSLVDFSEMGSSDTSPIWSLITEHFGVERAHVPSERLVDIFAEIQARKTLQ